MKKVLVLGGSNFIGRNLVEALMDLEKYELTLFNRQQSNTELFPQLRKLKGDRQDPELHILASEKWDYVVDLSCYYQQHLKNVLQHLPAVEHYVFISTCSVYQNEDTNLRFRDESTAILSCTAEEAIDESPQTYGARKAECERILQQSGHRHSILRPALVYGPYDPTDRFYYWLHQVKTQRQTILPEDGLRLFSTTYVKDLVQAILKALERSEDAGIYNVISKPDTSIAQIVKLSESLLNRQVEPLNASAEWLQAQEVKEWLDMPLWIHGDHFTYSNQRLGKELDWQASALENSLSATIQYYDQLNWPEPQYGLSAAQQSKLKEALKAGL